MSLLSFQVLLMDNVLERPLVASILIVHEVQVKYQPLQDQEEHLRQHRITIAPLNA